MGKILCATRGGEDSYLTQDAAIELAKERGDELAFLYVFDLNFLNKTAAPILVDVGNEVVKMGEFMLLIAQERASAQGITASIITRKGKLRDEIKKAAAQEDASLVILGSPAGPESAFAMESLKNFAAEIEAETGVETIIV